MVGMGRPLVVLATRSRYDAGASVRAQLLNKKPSTLLHHLRSMGQALKGEVKVYRLVWKHPRTPWLAKMLLALALGYLALPFDLIPDFLPVIGHVDDLVLVPALVVLALKLIPSDLVEECRAQAREES